MRGIIKQLLREGIDKNIEFTAIGGEVYNTIVNNLDTINYHKLTSDDSVMTTDDELYQLEGIKFNLKTLDKRFDVKIIFAKMLSSSNDTPASFDTYKQQLLFFIYPKYGKSPSSYNEYKRLAKQQFVKIIDELTFIHEFTHYLDKLRYKPSYEFKFPGDNPVNYFNSPEELNANFNQVLGAIKKTPSMLSFPIEMFINSALQLFDERLIDFITPKNLNKIKNRLYQYYTQNKKTQPINERLFDNKSLPQIGILNSFVKFAAKELGIKVPSIKLQLNHDGLVTTAAYGGNKISIYAKERALVDIMRSIAHEMTHMMQDSKGLLNPSKHAENNAAGSPIENEANAKAGEIIRKFGVKYPQIYI